MGSQWTFKAPLPNKVTNLRGVTINNKILMTGGYDEDDVQKSESNYNFYDTILQYDPDSDIWEVVGHMMETRNSHAVIVRDSGEFSDYCKHTTTVSPTTAMPTT